MRYFFTGSAAEITPIAKIDGIQVGAGKRGPITEKLQKAFFAIFEDPTQQVWLANLRKVRIKMKIALGAQITRGMPTRNLIKTILHPEGV